MCKRHEKALALVERTVTNLKVATERQLGSAYMTDGIAKRMADQYTRDAETLDTWTYIRDLLRNGRAMP